MDEIVSNGGRHVFFMVFCLPVAREIEGGSRSVSHSAHGSGDDSAVAA